MHKPTLQLYIANTVDGAKNTENSAGNGMDSDTKQQTADDTQYHNTFKTSLTRYKVDF